MSSVCGFQFLSVKKVPLVSFFVPFNFPSIVQLPERQTWSVSMADKATDPCKE